MVLLFFFGAQRRGLWSLDWLGAGAAQAGLIQAGQWWRTITALTLHVDHGHLLGNLLAGVVIGTVTAQLLGQGLAWLAILLAGSIGNVLLTVLINLLNELTGGLRHTVIKEPVRRPPSGSPRRRQQR